MKNTIVMLFVLFIAGTNQAQTNDKFVQVMEKTISGLDSLHTVEQWQTKSNAFERIAQKETKEWLPPYYVALSQIMMFNLEQDASKQEPLCVKAESYLARADSLNKDNSEIYVLKSMVAGMRIRLNPMINGQKYGPLAGLSLEKAKRLDPENPRAVMQEGVTLFFTPAQWGGDPEKGKELLVLASQKYEVFKPASSIHPAWGKQMNAYILEMTKK